MAHNYILCANKLNLELFKILSNSFINEMNK